MRILIYEDTLADDLAPLSLMRPVSELICGRESLRRRVQRWFPTAQCGARIRPWLADVYREEHPDLHVNDPDWLRQSATLLINGRWLPERRPWTNEITGDNAGFIDGHLAWISLDFDECQLLGEDSFHSALRRIASVRRIVSASGSLVRYPWDLVHRNHDQLIRDFEDEGLSQPPQSSNGQIQLLGSPEDVYISPQADLDPFVVLDTRCGPISIDQDVHVQAFTRIEGPCHISRGARLFRAQIRGGTTIGEGCRVGGEIDTSILHGFANKYHEGFLGHSYVCPWVNLGAITTTSDMKNNYSSIRVPLHGEPIESGLLKVGSFIGDHSKTAIDSMFNTGSSIGVMAMVLPGGRLLPRYIPSFCNVSFGELAADWPLEASLATAAIAMTRRGRELTPATEQLIRTLYEQTEPERQLALDRAVHRRMQT